MANAGVTKVAECGPGKVLAGMTKRIEETIESLSITDASSLNATLEALRNG
jgi:[acyl-carrier-protein] S-malonyltransferase